MTTARQVFPVVVRERELPVKEAPMPAARDAGRWKQALDRAVKQREEQVSVAALVAQFQDERSKVSQAQKPLVPAP
jgi:hypothetical protein